MKFASSLVLLALLSLAACTTTTNRRDMYRLPKPHGTWTQKERGLTLAGRYDHRSRTYNYVVRRQGPRPASLPTPPPGPPALPAQ